MIPGPAVIEDGGSTIWVPELLALMESSPALGIGLSQFLSLRIRELHERLSSR
mgnify:CR=1 FL=1